MEEVNGCFIYQQNGDWVVDDGYGSTVFCSSYEEAYDTAYYLGEDTEEAHPKPRDI